MQMENSSSTEKHNVLWHNQLVRALQLIFLSLSVLSFFSAIVMSYREGRANSKWMFSLEDVLFLLLFLSAAVLLFCMVASLLSKRNILAATLMFLVSFILFVGYFINHQRVYLLGFRNYAKNILTVEEWMTISRCAQTNMKPRDSLWVAENTADSLWNSDRNAEVGSEQKLWSEFTNQTQIQKLEPYEIISVPAPGRTEIEWGSAIVGHRGIIIYSNSNDISPPDDVWLGPSFFAPDMAAFLENN
ncbi:MAG TPA: hypothetical protein VH280_14960 [Verrucomicrobiae bacterium]|jgi:hypothetical protein|nr:hypothetical protein [Verrucomicrobiae bacterium]